MTLTGNSESGSTVAVLEGTTLLGTTTATAEGAWSVALSGLSDGTHALTVRAADDLGNTSESAMGDKKIQHRQQGAADGARYAGSGLSFPFSSTEAGSTFACRLDGPGGTGTYAPCTSPKAYSGLPDGDYTFRVRATDPAGNPDASDATRSFTLDRTAPAAPAVASPLENALEHERRSPSLVPRSPARRSKSARTARSSGARPRRRRAPGP